MRRPHIFALIACCLLLANLSFAQRTVISGKVIDAETGDPIPFANVVFVGTTIGATTDFVGAFQITTNSPTDSIAASYIGYKRKAKLVTKGVTQEINFQLFEDVQSLDEVVFVAGENPAWPIMRSAVRNKKNNDKRSLEAYEFESYNKIEIDLDNLTDRFRDRKIVKKVKQVIDSVDQIAGEDGQAVLPIFISESLSKYYYRQNPLLRKEHILKTKITGVGMDDGSLLSQFIGSSFQEYNFYQNWLNIWDKEFVSPIADGWRAYYEVYLMDSMMVGNHFCYRIDIFPKQKGDLAFNGSIWITKEESALKQVDLWVEKSANLNFIEKLKLQQELEPTEAGPWVPTRSRILTDFQVLAEFGLGKKAAGVLAKFFTSNKNVVVNQPKERRFYDQALEVEEDATTPDDIFWAENRHDPLTTTEINVINMIDTLRKIRPVKRLSDLATYVGTGYIPIKQIDLGPYPLFYAFNNVEDHRLKLGARTNIDFSKKWVLSGYLAYGTKDEKYKYSGRIDYIPSKKPWTTWTLSHTKDIQQIGLTFDDLFSGVSTLGFEAFFRNRRHFTPYFLTDTRFRFQKEIRKGVRQRVILRHKQYSPINLDSTFNFGYRLNPSLGDASPIRKDFSSTEITVETRIGKDELWIQSDNQRFSLGAVRAPVITLRYTLGLDNVLGGDFEFHRAAFNITKNFKMGLTGRSRVIFTAEKIFGEVPLPLLKGHIGNESPFFTSIAFNTMGFSEFVSDQYVALNYRHNFEGFLLNRIPLFKKLKWRAVGTANFLLGGVSDENLALHASVGENGLPTLPINSLGDTPYVELGYGIENILKVIRIDAIHRLTYLDNLQGDKFAVKFSFQFSF